MARLPLVRDRHGEIVDRRALREERGGARASAGRSILPSQPSRIPTPERRRRAGMGRLRPARRRAPGCWGGVLASLVVMAVLDTLGVLDVREWWWVLPVVWTVLGLVEAWLTARELREDAAALRRDLLRRRAIR